MENINDEIASLNISDEEIESINNMLSEKFNLFFENQEITLLKKIATPNLFEILKNVSALRFTKNGELSLDSIYTILRPTWNNLEKLNGEDVASIPTVLEKLLIILLIKIDETDEIDKAEKYFILNSISGSANKLAKSESVNLNEIIPNGYRELDFYTRNYSPQKKQAVKKPRKKVPEKLRAQLQKEINSKCPFCPNEDVGHFEVHHINGVPTNNDLSNLLLLCRICHSKIEKGDIPLEQVMNKKINLGQGKIKIEFYKITINSELCNWQQIGNVQNAFRLIRGEKSPYPIFQFHFINHYDKTIVLADVELKIKHLPSGLNGLPNPMKVTKGDILRLIIDSENNSHKLDNFDGIQIPANQSYIFQLELINKSGVNYYTLDTPKVLFFTLKFNGNISVALPKILINTEDENRGIKILVLR